MRNLMFVGLVALGALGCGGSGNNNNNGPVDMAMAPSNPDMVPACVSTTPASNGDFLNACTTADSVEITPFYPTDAPNGALPALQ